MGVSLTHTQPVIQSNLARFIIVIVSHIVEASSFFPESSAPGRNSPFPTPSVFQNQFCRTLGCWSCIVLWNTINSILHTHSFLFHTHTLIFISLTHFHFTHFHFTGSLTRSSISLVHSLAHLHFTRSFPFYPLTRFPFIRSLTRTLPFHTLAHFRFTHSLVPAHWFVLKSLTVNLPRFCCTEG